MNNKHLLVKSISILFLESRQPHKAPGTVTLVKDVLAHVKLPEVTMGLDREREIISNLVKTSHRLCDELFNEQASALDVLQQVTIDCGDDINTLEAIRAVVASPPENEDDVKSLINSLARTLRKFLRDEESKKIIYSFADKIRFKPEEIEDFGNHVMELRAKLEPYISVTEDKDPAVVAAFNLMESDKIDKVLEKIQKRNEGTGGFVFGFQRLNKMFGGQVPRGKFILVPALQHQHKTGTTLALFRQAAMYNKPIMEEGEEGRIPTLVRVSTEDEIEDNIEKLYRDTYFNVEKKPAEIGSVSIEYMRAYIQEKLTAEGWNIEFMRVNPTQWTYMDIERTVLELEAKGCCVQLFMLDYLMMIPTTGCETGGPIGNDRRDQVRRVRAFMSARNILFITPWQLSPDATKLLRLGGTDFVKQLPDKNYYSGSSQISQEADAEIFIHIERVNGMAWLTVQRGKYRIPGTVPEKDKYCALPMHPEGGLQDDLHGPDLGRSAPGGGDPAKGEQEEPFWA